VTGRCVSIPCRNLHTEWVLPDERGWGEIAEMQPDTEQVRYARMDVPQIFASGEHTSVTGKLSTSIRISTVVVVVCMVYFPGISGFPASEKGRASLSTKDNKALFRRCTEDLILESQSCELEWNHVLDAREDLPWEHSAWYYKLP
jgi:hypothetical protein